MDKKLLACLIYLLLAGLIFFGSQKIFNPVNPPQEIVLANNSFIGKQIAKNYYEFSVIDYHRFLIQKKPFVIFFYSQNCDSCQQQNRWLMEMPWQSAARDMPILRVNFQVSNSTKQENDLAKTYRVTQVHTFVAVDRDSNPVIYLQGTQDLNGITKLFTDI